EHVVVDAVGVPGQRPVVGASTAQARGRAALVEVARQGGVPFVPCRPTAEQVDRTTASRGHEPGGRVARYAVAGPGDQRLGERLLGEVLRRRKIACPT